jgi:hypothetical protein
MKRLTIWIAGVLLAVVATACGDDGVSRAEYDQKVSELALTQQELVTARERIGELETLAEGNDDVFADVETAVLEALGLVGITAPPGSDRVEVLAEAVAATTEERDMLLRAFEEGDPEFGPGFDVDRVLGLLDIARVMQDWARPTSLPEVTELTSVEITVGQVGDEMVTLAYEALIEAYPDADTEDRIGLLLDVAFWAVDIARSSLPG